ncbi:MAG TPA: hypothetical protein VF581_01210 [Flavobacterium sp.]|jgi:hypothetical protein
MQKLLLLAFWLVSCAVFSQKITEPTDPKESTESKLKEKLKDLKREVKQTRQTKDATRKLARVRRKLDNPFLIDTTRMIVYDFKIKKYVQSNIHPRVGEPIIFKIININRLAYEVQIESADVAIADEFFSDKTAAATADVPASRPPAQGNNSGASQTVSLSPKSFTDQNKIPQPEFDKINTLKDALEKSGMELQRLNAELNTNTNLKAILDTNKADLTLKLQDINNKITASEALTPEVLNQKKEWEGTLDKTVKSIADLETKIATGTTDLASVNALITTKLNELNKYQNELTDFYGTFFKLVQMRNDIAFRELKLQDIEFDYQNFRRLALDPLLTSSNYSSDERSRLRQELPRYSEDIFSFERQAHEFEMLYNIAINDWKLLDQLTPDARENVRAKYLSLHDDFDRIVKHADVAGLRTKLIKISAMDDVLGNELAYEMVSSPIQPLEDYVTFDIKIKNRDDKKYSEYSDDREFSYVEYTKGGVRFDFSTGPVFDFQLDKKDDDDDDYYDSYELKDVVIAGVPRTMIVGTSKNAFTPSLAGLFHTSFRRSGNCAFGFTLGASINVETFELNSLFPGVSLLIGKKQKIIFTAGPALKQVNILKANYSLNEDYNPADFNTGTELTSKEFRIGAFFGISYNLTQKQRGKFKIDQNE